MLLAKAQSRGRLVGAGLHLRRGLFRSLAAQPYVSSTESARHDSSAYVYDLTAEQVDEEEKRYLKGLYISPIPDVPGWDMKLATLSEAVVKAERHVDGRVTPDTILAMQDLSLRYIRAAWPDDPVNISSKTKGADDT